MEHPPLEWLVSLNLIQHNCKLYHLFQNNVVNPTVFVNLDGEIDDTVESVLLTCDTD